ARFLGGREQVEIVAPPIEKTFELRVVAPVEDMTELGARATEEALDGDEKALASGGSIWPHVDRAIVEAVRRHRSAIAFASSRRLGERITASMNELYEELLAEGDEAGAGVDSAATRPPRPAGDARRPPAQLMGASGQTSGAESVLARAHHGSVS